jgi:DNA replication protein DnaC
MKLRRLTNSEYDEAASRAHSIKLDECPTCGAHPIEVSVGVTGFEGTCDSKHKYGCQEQMNLRKHYLVANIGDQYHRLNWDEYDYEPVRNTVATYLDSWATAKRLGIGVEFYGKGLGAGKTFAATYVGKELIKQGEVVYMIPFDQVVSLYSRSNAEEMDQRLKNTTLLILDELSAPTTVAQGGLFSAKFEELARHRTNFNLPTIVTTNLTRDEFAKHYPKPYSLMEAKQMQVEVLGDDARVGKRRKKNRDLLTKKEAEPVT